MTKEEFVQSGKNKKRFDRRLVCSEHLHEWCDICKCPVHFDKITSHYNVSHNKFDYYLDKLRYCREIIYINCEMY